jgi:hypothetical protein
MHLPVTVTLSSLAPGTLYISVLFSCQIREMYICMKKSAEILRNYE